jgi:hypothetical protein
MDTQPPEDQPLATPDDGTSGPGPAPMRVQKRPRALVLWSVLAVLALAAGGLAVLAARDDSSPRALPLQLGADGRSSAAGAAAPEGAADMAMPYNKITYVAGDDLPAMGGHAPVYKISAAVAESDVARLARAFGLSGDVKREESSWIVRDGDKALQVSSGSPAWWNYTSSSGGAIGYAESGSGTCSSDGTVCKSVPPSVACPADAPDCTVTIPEEPKRPDDLPSKDEARTIGLEVLRDAGFAVDGAEVRVEDGFIAWSVGIEPAIDGTPTMGIGQYVSVGSKGVINDGGGSFGTPERVDSYPLIDAKEAVKRLNDGGFAYGGWYAGGVAMDSVGAARNSSNASGSGVPGSSSGSSDTAVTDGTVQADPAPDKPTCAPEEGCTTPGSSGGGSTGSGGEPPPCPDTPGAATDCYAPGPDEPPTTTVPPCKPQPDGREICEAPAPGPGPDPAPPVCGDPSSGAPTTTAAPPDCVTPEPMPEPEPIEVTLHEAELVLIAVPSWNGGDAYVVPAYRMTGKDSQGNDSEATIIAIDAEFLEPPADMPVPVDKGVPTPLPANETDVPVPTAVLESGDPEIGVAYYAEMLTNRCGLVTVGDSSWQAVDGSDLSGWATPTEGGTFTRLDKTTAEFVGDEARTKVAKLTLVSGDPTCR